MNGLACPFPFITIQLNDVTALSKDDDVMCMISDAGLCVWLRMVA